MEGSLPTDKDRSGPLTLVGFRIRERDTIRLDFRSMGGATAYAVQPFRVGMMDFLLSRLGTHMTPPDEALHWEEHDGNG